ncbi:MAG TPA: glycosyl hydrolase family 28 protein, partial [bacterium]
MLKLNRDVFAELPIKSLSNFKFLAFGLWVLVCVSFPSSTSAQTITITSAPYNASTGSADNAAAIQAAINAVGSGGTVVVPSGTFLSGPITLKSNMTFQLASGSILRMTAMGTFAQNTAFVYGTGLSNITINGSGTMDGQGAAWWTAFNAGGTDNRPPAMILLNNCKGVTTTGITVKDSPKFHVQFLGNGSNIYAAGLSITAAWPSPNTDGIDLRGTNVLIENCYISDGDDVIQVGGSSNLCSGITIRGCAFGTGHGLSIGGYTQGGVNNLLVDNCTFNGTQYGIRWKTGRDRGGVINNLTYSNITMTNILLYPFFLTSWYPNPSSLPPTSDTTAAITSTTPYWSNITLRNITASTASSGAKSPGIMWAVPEAPVSNVLLDGVTVTGPSGVNFEFHHARGVTINCNCRVNGAQPPTNVGSFDATISYPPCGPTPTPGAATNTPTFTSTKTNTPMPPTSTSTFTSTKTNTPVPPTATFTVTSTNTNSPVPSTPTFTNTPVPPTSTFTFTSTKTNTPVPPTSTNTPVPPTLTFTATSTSTKTNTPVPPTFTFTNTSVLPTFTNTPMPPTVTNTPAPPTATNTNSPVPPTATNTPIPPTSTNTPLPPTVTNTSVPPTNTLTPVPPTFTNTPLPPTATNTPVPPTSTNTPLPPTVTSTPIPLTSTATNTPMPPTSTNTPVPPTNTL